MTHSRDEQMKFHIESGDYFSTLATVLNLIQDAFTTSMPGKQNSHILSLETLNTLKEELLFLQKHYTIVKKPE